VIGLNDPFIIARIEPQGLAARMGLLPGERILTANGVDLHDEIDWSNQVGEEFLRLRVLGRDGSVREIEGQREYGVPFGAEFEARQPRRCHNNCVFCFVYQHPKGVRKELLVKDDDYALSFVHGNFITLTNLAEKDFQRILEERLSPLYVSVHATDPEVRVRMMKNPKSGLILDHLDRLARAGIEAHTQLVICPGWNDGAVLTRSIEDLAARHPWVRSIAVVPVGLTRHRERLPGLRTFQADDARHALREVHAHQRRFLAEKGTRLVFAADEMYVLAGAPIPSAAEYEDFPQHENGIGMLRATEDRWRAGEDTIHSRNGRRERVAVVTGTSAAPTLEALFAERPPRGVEVDLCVVENEYFGPTVTVSGLLVGADIERALRARPSFDRALLPPNCLKEGEIFLDDRTRSDLSRALGVPVEAGFDPVAATR
jgi:putative radical SAM enzyme (TIGR03279 family)